MLPNVEPVNTICSPMYMFAVEESETKLPVPTNEIGDGADPTL